MTTSFNTLGVLHSFIRQGRSLVLDYGGPRVAVTALTDSLIRVRLAPDGEFLVRRSWAVARADEEFGEAAFDIEESDRELLLRTASLTVRIDREQRKSLRLKMCKDNHSVPMRLVFSGVETESEPRRSNLY